MNEGNGVITADGGMQLKTLVLEKISVFLFLV